MREIALIVISLISSVLFYKFAYDEKKERNTSGAVLMTTLGSLSAVCVLISAYTLFTK